MPWLKCLKNYRMAWSLCCRYVIRLIWQVPRRDREILFHCRQWSPSLFQISPLSFVTWHCKIVLSLRQRLSTPNFRLEFCDRLRDDKQSDKLSPFHYFSESFHAGSLFWCIATNVYHSSWKFDFGDCLPSFIPQKFEAKSSECQDSADYDSTFFERPTPVVFVCGEMLGCKV